MKGWIDIRRPPQLPPACHPPPASPRASAQFTGVRRPPPSSGEKGVAGSKQRKKKAWGFGSSRKKKHRRPDLLHQRSNGQIASGPNQKKYTASTIRFPCDPMTQIYPVLIQRPEINPIILGLWLRNFRLFLEDRMARICFRDISAIWTPIWILFGRGVSIFRALFIEILRHHRGGRRRA